MQKSTYSKPDYVLSFGVNDVIYVDLEVLIIKRGETFSLNIIKSQVCETQMEFATYLIRMLSDDGLSKFTRDLRLALEGELSTQLFTLFYAGTILPDESQTQQAS